MQMKELSPTLKEKSLSGFDMEGASKKPLDTKRRLPSKAFGKVLGGGQLDPTVKNSSKLNKISANMKEKLSDHKLESTSEYSAKQKKNVTFDVETPRFGRGFTDALKEDMQARSSLRELHQKFNDVQIEGSSSKFDHFPRYYASTSSTSKKYLEQFREEGFVNPKGFAQLAPKGGECAPTLRFFSGSGRQAKEKNKEDFVLICKNEQLSKSEDSAVGIGGSGNGEVEDADWEFVFAE
jgi:hypothetical protein